LDIVILSTYDTDGSGIFARQLLRATQKLGYTAQIITVRSNESNSDISSFFSKNSVWGLVYLLKLRLSTYLYRTKSDYAFLETHSIGKRMALSSDILPNDCKLIICTFLSGMFSPKTFSAFTSKFGDVPVIFYGVDMNLFTGGCHYSQSCQQYTLECSHCPAITPAAHFFVRRNFQRKYEMVKSLIKHTVIASSDQHYKQIKKSRIFERSNIQEILSSVDERIFGVHENIRHLIKIEYNLRSKVLLIRSSAESRKGSQLFIDSIRLLELKNPELISCLSIVTVGDNFISEQLVASGCDLHSLGYIADENELSKLYGAADFFINPSLADGGPMMLAQSLMSYTPVITTNVGLASNLIFSGKSGAILKEITAVELLNEIEFLCSKERKDLDCLRRNTRKIAMKYLSRERYIKKLDELLKDNIG